MYNNHNIEDENGFEIAIIGMSGRFPGASDLDDFWNNLRDGKESISTFNPDEILDSGIDPLILNHPNYVKAGSILDDVDLFDAAFFKFSPREARIMDPQHRLFLECAYEALQNAGIDPQRYDGSIGVFAGANSNTYKQHDSVDVQDPAGYNRQDYLGNDRSFLSTRVSYKLNLKGPSLTIQTACSTSLVATHMAYQSLLSGECDIALGGGASIRFPQKTGYFYSKEGIRSPDGHCRAFDISAQGTVGGEGIGIVVMKRLADALADGNSIQAIIKGSALNNDGSRKAGFTAPSVEGQAKVISRALAMAEVNPDSIGYIEAHGTGTIIGDPIEIAALTRAFRGKGCQKNQFCAIGSLKTNLGHLDSAAGVAGLIKTVLMLQHRQIPPSLHYKEGNPQIDFEHSPFFVNSALTEWQAGSSSLRAGVSSFGIGGSNVHMVLQEAPQIRASFTSSRPAKLLLLSAKIDTTLERASEELAVHLRKHPRLALADVAFTLQTGRQQFKYRRMLVCHASSDAVTALESRDPKIVFNGISGDERRPVVFMFPGQGAQYVDMGRELYEIEPGFREPFDQCCELLMPAIGIDLRKLLFPAPEDSEQATRQINQTSITQPALFAIEYSLAQLWNSWGVNPQAMIGHSIGEFVAACLAGVFNLADALSLVSVRARMMQEMGAGSMLAIPMAVDKVRKVLTDELSVAAINAPSMCVVSGPTDAVSELESGLAKQAVECRRLHTSHAFHSRMMEPVRQSFEDLVRDIEIGKPKIPYISNLTGDWVTAEQVEDPAYWGRHLRETVQFAAGLETLFENPASLFLEVGPGQTLSTLVRGNPAKKSEHVVIASMRHPNNRQSDSTVLLNSLGRLWLVGVDVDWTSFHSEAPPMLVPLPGYPFERQSYWIDQRLATDRPRPIAANNIKLIDPGHWFYVPGWKSAVEPLTLKNPQLRDGPWLVFSDGSSLAERVVNQLIEQGREVAVVVPGSLFSSHEVANFTMRPNRHDDMVELFGELRLHGKMPRTILHLWSIAPLDARNISDGDAEQAMTDSFYSLLHLAQVLDQSTGMDPVEIVVIASGTQSVSGDESLCPQHAAISGLCHVIPQEQDRLRCRSIDIEFSNDSSNLDQKARQILQELSLDSTDSMIALRPSGRWRQVFNPVILDQPVPPDAGLRENGVYLITGGFGKIGLELGQYLAQTVAARLVLIGRSEIPARDSWDDCLASMGEASAVGSKILAIRALEEAGAEVLAFTADVTSEERMRAVIDQATSEFGQINGVIHAAASIGQESFQLLRDLDRESCELQFLPKIRGLQVLDRVLEGLRPDFCILMSSLASLLGGLRFGAYASANAFLDAFARSRSGRDGLPWMSVNWDGWYFGNPESSSKSTVARLAMTPAEGVNAFARLVQIRPIPQLVISTCDLQTRLEQWAQPSEALESESPVPGNVSQEAQSEGGPADTTREAIERRLSAIWSELIGVESIGLHDNFFDLGGDSLLALQVTSRLRESLLADLSAATVLESPTIAELSERVMEQQQSMNNSDQVSAMLQQIKSISPEDKEKLLTEARMAQGLGK